VAALRMRLLVEADGYLAAVTFYRDSLDVLD
jgi:hypothetical protein